MSSVKNQSGYSRKIVASFHAGPYRTPMADGFLHGTVHHAAPDLQAAIAGDPALLALWQSLTPLGRNEFICWVDDAKQPATRQRRIQRTGEELREGKRRPCCWAGCIHRDDKPPGAWQQAMLAGKRKG